MKEYQCWVEVDGSTLVLASELLTHVCAGSCFGMKMEDPILYIYLFLFFFLASNGSL